MGGNDEAEGGSRQPSAICRNQGLVVEGVMRSDLHGRGPFREG
jgi:hypothetical protein